MLLHIRSQSADTTPSGDKKSACVDFGSKNNKLFPGSCLLVMTP